MIEFSTSGIVSTSLATNPEAIRTSTDVCDSLFFEPLLESLINAPNDTVFLIANLLTQKFKASSDFALVFNFLTQKFKALFGYHSERRAVFKQ